jgi:hypothetical protein
MPFRIYGDVKPTHGDSTSSFFLKPLKKISNMERNIGDFKGFFLDKFVKILRGVI